MYKKTLIQPVILGKIGSCYGIHGWLRMLSLTEHAENIFNYLPWFIKTSDQWKEIKLENWCYCHKKIILKLDGVNNRNIANMFTNCNIVVDSSQLPKLRINSYYWKDLIGCQVITKGGYNLGRVIEIMETGSNDVLIIQANLGDIFGIKKRLIPFLEKNVIKKVDLTVHTIEVDWDPGF